MKKFGNLFFRPALALVVMMLVVAAAMPTSASAMLALQTYDFNNCSLPGGWTYEGLTGVTGVSAETVGAFTGDAHLKITLPAGTYATIGSNANAPRVMTPITDTNFEVEARFLAPQISTTDGFKIEGLVFRDSSQVAALVDPHLRWLRIDFNSQNGVIESYISFHLSGPNGTYIGGTLKQIDNGTPLTGFTGNEPILIRVNYVQTTGAWTVTYTQGSNVDVVPFNETAFESPFAPNSMGIFVANDSDPDTGLLGHETRVDYIHVSGTTLNDDAAVVTVNTVGNGTVTQTACPSDVTGDVVRLQAVAGAGDTFAGWSGDASGTTNPLDLTMDGPKTVTATFTEEVELDLFLYLPTVSK